MGEGFTWDTQDRDRDIAAAEAAFGKARDMMASGDYALVVMDEINIALRYDYLRVEDVIAGLEARAEGTTAVLTGRDAKPELCAYADLVTEMREVKHPFHAGIKAQRGVDF
ncbi:cob(I)yrinic acid a,c-diamide adenosyltransferase [Sulfitobacter sp. PS-8MA]